MLPLLGSKADADPPRVSVVVSAFTVDRLDLITQAIESLRAQTVPPHEIVLVVDYSPALEARCRGRWPGIQVIPNREEQGLSGARNTGIAATEGEVVAFLDDDAVAVPGWIEHLGRAYSDRGVLGVGGAVRPAWTEGRPAWFPKEFDWVVGCTHSGMPQEVSPVRNPVGANMSFRRDVLTEMGGFRYELGRDGTMASANGKTADARGAVFKSGDETDLCIRIHARFPDGRILFDPAAAVDHHVPATRANLRYFLFRCRGEGHAKAVLAGMVGTRAGLSEERLYARQTLPLGFLRYLGSVARGDFAGAARAAAIAVGLAMTTVGYLSGRREAGRQARNRDVG